VSGGNVTLSGVRDTFQCVRIGYGTKSGSPKNSTTSTTPRP